MNPITHECLQGSQEWLDLRAKYFTASELPAAAGESKYQKRSDLLKAKATGIVPNVDAAKQRLFDAGHAAEAAARSIVEEQLGTELFPVTMSAEVDGLPLLASLDGISMLGGIIWENKLLNESLKAAVLRCQLDSHYTLQIEQQLLVSGAEKCYFTTSDGTPEGTFGMWYESDPNMRAKIVAIWKQFEKDLADYQHVETKPAAVAEGVKDLPAVMVQVSGSVSIVDNFVLFETALRDFVENKLVRSPQTDQDFVDLDAQIKSLKKAEDALDAAEVQMIAQVASVDSMKRTKDMLHKLARDNRLMAEKLLNAEKENRKAEIVTKARGELVRHMETLYKRVGVNSIPVDIGVFAEAIKGLKSLDSMRDKVYVALANAKIEANAIADRIEANRKKVESFGDMSLFPDFDNVCTKLPDDFAALLSMRVNARKEAESKRLEAERERIRAEEQAKAQREAESKMAAERAEANRIAAEEIRRIDAERKAAALAEAEKLKAEQVEAAKDFLEKNNPTEATTTGTAETPLTGNQEASLGATIKLGEICSRLGFTITAEFLASLGYRPIATDKNAKMYSESQWRGICSALVQHISNVAVGMKRLEAKIEATGTQLTSAKSAIAAMGALA